MRRSVKVVVAFFVLCFLASLSFNEVKSVTTREISHDVMPGGTIKATEYVFMDTHSRYRVVIGRLPQGFS